MEPLAAMAKQLASALNQAAKSFASVKKELAETKAALAQTQKKSLDDKIALVCSRVTPLTNVSLIEFIDPNPDGSLQSKHETSP
jgi:hypothetical protein